MIKVLFIKLRGFPRVKYLTHFAGHKTRHNRGFSVMSIGVKCPGMSARRAVGRATPLEPYVLMVLHDHLLMFKYSHITVWLLFHIFQGVFLFDIVIEPPIWSLLSVRLPVPSRAEPRAIHIEGSGLNFLKSFYFLLILLRVLFYLLSLTFKT